MMETPSYEQLKEKIESLGTDLEVANKLNVNRVSVWRWRTGKSDIDPFKWKALQELHR